MFLPRSTGLAISAPSRLVRRQPVRELSWFSGWSAPKATPPVVVDESLPVAQQTAAVPAPTTSTDTVTPPFPERPAPVSPAQPSASSSAAFSTVNQAEIDHFSRLSSQWWNEKGEFGLLHKMNPTRMEFVRQKIENGRVDDRGWTFATRNAPRAVGAEGRWLEGMDVLDVGCGGGLLSESLARVGGNVLGIDASSHNIAIASLHASQDPFLPFHSDSPLTAGKSNSVKTTGSLRYRHTSAERLREEGKQYDVVCSMEVLEHVDSPGEFLKCLADMVKPGGHLILSTISRTPLSQLLTITLAEHVLRLVTPGTHTHAKYIKPAELLAFVRDELGGSRVWESDGDGLVDGGREGGGVAVGEVRGIVYDPLAGKWRLWKEGVPFGDLCNYMFHVRKKA